MGGAVKHPPLYGPMSLVSTDRTWFDRTDAGLVITQAVICAFWAGVKKYGRNAVNGKPTYARGPEGNGPTGGSPVLMRKAA